MATASPIRSAAPIHERVSVIIPTLNEARRLPGLLERLILEEPRPEVIVVDGGSLDGTADTARIWAHHLLVTRSARGHQLNCGAEIATGEILWFLHADSQPPRHAIAKILEILHNRPELLGGAFRLKFDQRTAGLRAIAWGANLRSRLFDLPWGDQGLFVRASVFRELGGFPDYPVMEDFAFQRLLAKRGKTVILPELLTTSARRYDKLGTFRAMQTNFQTLWWYYRGHSMEDIQKKFRKPHEQGGGADE